MRRAACVSRLLWMDQRRVGEARAAAAGIGAAELAALPQPWWDLARFATLLVAVGDHDARRPRSAMRIGWPRTASSYPTR